MAKEVIKLLVGVNEICSYLGVSKPLFYKFIDLGMPARIIEGRWYAHSSNLHEYFRRLTLVSMKDQISEEIPEEAE